MKKLFFVGGLLTVALASAVIQVDTIVVSNNKEEAHEQLWYVGDHIKRSCGDITFDGTIRQIYGDEVTVHCSVKKGEEIAEEQDIKVVWEQEGAIAFEGVEFKIKLTDLYDQHQKRD